MTPNHLTDQNETTKLPAINPKIQYPFVTLTNAVKGEQGIYNLSTVKSITVLNYSLASNSNQTPVEQIATNLFFSQDDMYTTVMESLQEIHELIYALNSMRIPQKQINKRDATSKLTLTISNTTKSIDTRTITDILPCDPSNKYGLNGKQAIACLDKWNEGNEYTQTWVPIKESVQEIAELMNVINKPISL